MYLYHYSMIHDKRSPLNVINNKFLFQSGGRLPRTHFYSSPIKIQTCSPIQIILQEPQYIYVIEIG